MITQDLCEELVSRYNGWNLDGEHGVLRYLNKAHLSLMTQECEQLLVLDEATGVLPLLTTTAGEPAYNAADSIWRIAEVLIATDDNYQVDYDSPRMSQRNEVVVAGMRYYPFPFVRQTRDRKDSSNPARIIFSQDPGDTTDRFYLRQYRRPTDILSLSIQHDVPPPYDYDILLPATGKLIEAVQSGNYAEAHQALKVFKSEMAEALNGGIQGSYDCEPVRREF